MDRTERFYKIDQLLKESKNRCVPLCRFIAELEVSRSTIKRDIEYLRYRLNAPIVWERKDQGYRYGQPEEGVPQYVLPGLWFNESELHALLGMESLLADLQPGLLDRHLEPLRKRIHTLLGRGGHDAQAIARRIKITHLAARPVPGNHFTIIMTALLDRRRLRIRHYNRSTAQNTWRTISPQRLIYYRDNWYLESWCHLRNGLRRFAVDAINHIEPLSDKPASEISDQNLDQEFSTTYGIFPGSQAAQAVLRFSPECSRWVAREEWHPEQQGRLDDQGRYILTLPYSHDTELLMDILRYGPEVEILEPQKLRLKLRELLEQTLKQY